MTTDVACRCCESDGLQMVLSLGDLPLANALLLEEDLVHDEKTYPLDLAFCPHCSLLQITETVDPKVLFGEYLYFSSFSETMLNHAKKLAALLIKKQKLSRESLVVEIASNDGYLLQYFSQEGVPVLGVEPAENIAQAAQKKGIPTVCKFFNTATATELNQEGRLADVIIGNNVLAHVADLNGFVDGVRVLLKPGGLAVFEFPYAGDMIEHNEFDTIYHEHLCYYSLTAIQHLFSRHGLVVTGAERISIHGGSLRVFIQHESTGVPEDTLEALLGEEKKAGMDALPFYNSFASNVLDIKQEMLDLLSSLKSSGKSIVGYGAAAKGSTLLNYFEVGVDSIDYIVDRSPHKQGRYMAGNRIPIESPEKIKETRPDYIMILPWNLKTEITEQMAFVREWGGQFIIPIPKAVVV